MKKPYKVVAKCGHVGRHYYVDKPFVVMAESGKDAAKIVRAMPRVKHNQKDAIRSVEKISFASFYKLKRKIFADPFFRCRNIQEQRKFIIYGVKNEECQNLKPKEINRTKKYNGKHIIRDQKKYFTHYISFEEKKIV